MTNAEQQTIADAYLDATVRHDIDALRALMTEDFTLWMVPSARDHGMPVPMRGREAFLKFVGQLHDRPTMWKPRAYKPQEFLFSEDSVAVRVRLIGDYPSGLEYDNEYVFIYRFDGDRICEMREFTDTMFIAGLAKKAAEMGA